MLSINPNDPAFQVLFQAAVKVAVEQCLPSKPVLDPLMTIPEAADYLRLTEAHVRRLVHGRPYRPASKAKPERPAELPKIPSCTVGGSKGTRVRLSALDAYLQRPAYRQAS